MNRITQLQLDTKAAHVSGMLRGLRVEVQRRNGSTALDLYEGTSCVQLLTVGTARQVADFLDAMAETLYIVGRASWDERQAVRSSREAV